MKAILVAFLILPLPVLRADLLRNGSFEDPASGGDRPFPKSSLTDAPTGVGWDFSKGAGIQLAAEKDVHFYAPGDRAPDGKWIAFLQGKRATLSQGFNAPAAGRYRVSYMVAGRAQSPPFGGDTRYEVRVNERVVGAANTRSHQPWTPMAHDFVAPAGSNLLSFVRLSPNRMPDGGETFLLDQVSVVSAESGGMPGAASVAGGTEARLVDPPSAATAAASMSEGQPQAGPAREGWAATQSVTAPPASRNRSGRVVAFTSWLWLLLGLLAALAVVVGIWLLRVLRAGSR